MITSALALTALLAAPLAVIGQCYFKKTQENRCVDSVSPACPECYQSFGDPERPIRCSYEDVGANANLCGGSECLPATVNLTINWRTGVCHMAGTGPSPQSYDYCWMGYEDTWLETPGGTCDNDDTNKNCNCG